MVKLKFYGLGGQGVVTAGKIFAIAVSLFENKYATTIPAYGHERRGAPVNTSVIMDAKPILLSSFVYDPDVVLVMDPTVNAKGVNISEGIHENSILVLNSDDPNVLAAYSEYNFKAVYYVNGTDIAIEVIGRPIPNTSMLGALAATGLLKIESIEGAIRSAFGKKGGDKNAEAARRAYERTKKA